MIVKDTLSKDSCAPSLPCLPTAKKSALNAESILPPQYQYSSDTRRLQIIPRYKSGIMIHLRGGWGYSQREQQTVPPPNKAWKRNCHVYSKFMPRVSSQGKMLKRWMRTGFTLKKWDGCGLFLKRLDACGLDESMAKT